MKKYKLIKEYPGSPNLGTIVDHHFSNSQYGFCVYDTEKSDNWKEFWEEIIEKDYEILELSLMRSDKHHIVNVIGNGEGYIESLLNCNGNKIHSIKRLSDNEVFTIGDNIKSYLNSNNQYHPINNFEIRHNELFTNAYSVKYLDGLYNYRLENIVKIKKPLFTTKDGVDIFEGDKYSVIDIFENRYRVTHHTTMSGPKSSRYILISTREKAEEYILMNKPCLSLNDVESCTALYYPAIREMLKELVKSKL